MRPSPSCVEETRGPGSWPERGRMKVLAIRAPPAHIEDGWGGMLAKSARKGHDVYLFVASDGALGGDAGVRRREQEEAARSLRVRDVFWGRYLPTPLPP